MADKSAEGKSRLEILEEKVDGLVEAMESLVADLKDVRKSVPKKGLFGGKRQKTAVLDKTTKKVYPSKAAVGKALATEADTDGTDHFAWYKLLQKFPDRFEALAEDDPRAIQAWKKQEDELQAEVDEANKKLAEEAKKGAKK